MILNNIRRIVMRFLNFLYERLPINLKRVIMKIIHYILKIKKLRLEINIVEHCNLNCIGCNHFSPLAEESYISIDNLRKDLEQIYSIFKNEISQVELLGGEPLLHPEICEILLMVRKILPKSKIIVLTNGTLIHKMKESFFKICKENHIVIMVTNYPINISYNDIIKKVNSQGIACYLFNYEDEKTMFKTPISLEGAQDQKTMFDLCVMANNCVTLKEGKLYTCMVIPNIRHFNKYFNKDLHVTPDDYIDIYACVSKKEIRKFLNSSVPFCKYCMVDKKEYGISWSVSKRSIREWI